MREKVIVVGAGALGLSVSYFLKEAGFDEIYVFERGLPAEGSTSKASGLISHSLWNTLDIKLVKRSLEFFKELGKVSGGRFSVKRLGLLRLFSSDRYFDQIEGELELQRNSGVNVEEIGRDVVEKMGLRSFKRALYYPDDCYADPTLYVLLLYEILRRRGVEFRLLESVERIVIEGGKVRGVITNDFVKGDMVILATGAWTREILKREGLPLPLKPYRAQAGILVMGKEPEIPAVHDLDSGIYFFPEVSKNLIVGDGTEEKEVDPFNFSGREDENFIYNVLGRLTEIYAPSKEARFVKGWAGLCSATPDRHPLIGVYPGVEGLYLLCGMNGFGFMRAPGLGEILADLIVGKKSAIDLAPFLVSRFRNLTVDFKIRQGFNPQI
jgi:sarcosine oxidase subunit beta